ncbi:hypothetical protein NPX89_30055, partial [Bacillus mycoides]|nr:hypothetical protein [Bacillus mycoides]
IADGYQDNVSLELFSFKISHMLCSSFFLQSSSAPKTLQQNHKNVHTVYQNIADEVEKRIDILEGMTTVNG